MKKKIYIAGPMTGIYKFNFPAFTEAQSKLEAQGWDVINPADLDAKAGFDLACLMKEWKKLTYPDGDIVWERCWKKTEQWILENHFDKEAAIKRDIDAIMQCDAIYMLSGWRESTGATAEYHLAKWRGLDVIEQNAESFGGYRSDKPVHATQVKDTSQGMAILHKNEQETILEEAQRLVHGDRGEAYGHPADDYQCVSDQFNALMRHKYDKWKPMTNKDAIMFMMCVKLSRECNKEKKDNRRDLAGYIECLDMTVNRDK